MLTCQECGNPYPFTDPCWRCDCGGLLDIEFNPPPSDPTWKNRPPSLWRYREALPLGEDVPAVTFGEGYTPLVPLEVDGRTLLLKQEHLFPSGSYKDRGASVLVTHAKSLGVERVVEDSSGNAGCAIATYCARAGIACDVYVPETTSPAKLAQIEMLGATLHRVPGSREDTAGAAMRAAESAYYASHVWNPFFFQGTKTFAYEVWEQLGGRAPDRLILPAGNGTLLIGAALGFKELRAAGAVSSLPRLVAVQAAACAPLHALFHGRGVDSETPSPTQAEGIAIARPARARQMIGLIRDSGGTVVTVTEGEIDAALTLLCRSGFYVEPTSAVALAAYPKLTVSPDETVVAPLTGHGLKSTEKMRDLLSR